MTANVSTNVKYLKCQNYLRKIHRVYREPLTSNIHTFLNTPSAGICLLGQSTSAFP